MMSYWCSALVLQKMSLTFLLAFVTCAVLLLDMKQLGRQLWLVKDQWRVMEEKLFSWVFLLLMVLRMMKIKQVDRSFIVLSTDNPIFWWAIFVSETRVGAVPGMLHDLFDRLFQQEIIPFKPDFSVVDFFNEVICSCDSPVWKWTVWLNDALFLTGRLFSPLPLPLLVW